MNYSITNFITQNNTVKSLLSGIKNANCAIVSDGKQATCIVMKDCRAIVIGKKNGTLNKISSYAANSMADVFRKEEINAFNDKVLYLNNVSF